mmetsp:Transcript_44342/g.110271  ORF Transcript_44342/g.110271 Transcript_44342/m.110271 type:complete len:251 (+) Transcript_44342:1362-2114(+)
MVPLPPGLRLLALGGGHQHAAELRGAQPARRRRRRRPHPVCQRESCDRLLPLDEPADDHAGAGAEADHFQPRPPQQAVDTSADPRAQPALLLDRPLLQEERAGAADADEPAQEGVDRRVEGGGLRASHAAERFRGEGDGRAVGGVREGGAAGDRAHARATHRRDGRQDGREEAHRGERGQAHVVEHRAVPRHDARYCCLLNPLRQGRARRSPARMRAQARRRALGCHSWREPSGHATTRHSLLRHASTSE